MCGRFVITLPDDAMARLFERLQDLENEKSLDFVKVDAAKSHATKPKKAVTVKRAAAAQRKPVKRTASKRARAR